MPDSTRSQRTVAAPPDHGRGSASPWRRGARIAALLAASVAVAGVLTFFSFQPQAVTLGPSTTLYFTDDPSFSVRVHEAVHRRQMRDMSVPGRVWNAIRYNFDYGYRLDEEAEARAGELCLQMHRFSPRLSAWTEARSVSQARAYRAWVWERIGLRVPDRVGQQLRDGAACPRILRGVQLDLPPGTPLREADELKLATLRYLQAHESGERVVETWKARLELVGLLDPGRWTLPDDTPPFGLIDLARAVAPAPDTAISPDEAGQAFHRFTYAMARRMYVVLRPPAPGYRGRELLDPDAAREAMGSAPDAWPGSLLQRGLRQELDDRQTAWLEDMALHPAHADVEVFARSPAADIAGRRYRLDAVDAHLPPPDIDPVRDAFLAQWGRAALAAQQADTLLADSILRTIVAGALRWAEEAPTEVEVVAALDLLEPALEDLAWWAEAVGGEEPEWADRLHGLREDEWLRGARTALVEGDPGSLYLAMPMIALDPHVPHAFKRAAYGQVALTDVCLELRTDDSVRAAHGRWRSAVELGLIRRPSDRALLQAARGAVRDLLNAADVHPYQVCSPVTGVQPGARMAIIHSAPRSANLPRRADDI